MVNPLTPGQIIFCLADTENKKIEDPCTCVLLQINHFVSLELIMKSELNFYWAVYVFLFQNSRSIWFKPLSKWCALPSTLALLWLIRSKTWIPSIHRTNIRFFSQKVLLLGPLKGKDVNFVVVKSLKIWTSGILL